jgi:predicted nucleic acid-binding protein
VAFAVLLDASVLVPAALCDTLLRAAAADFYRLVWSADILAELERALMKPSVGLSEAQARRRLQAMRDAFPEAAVETYHALVEAIPRVHPDDRHVVAAAIKAGAQVIVTLNLEDFPREALDPYALDVQSPDEFLQHLYHLDPERMTLLITEQAEALSTPPLAPRDICENLRPFAPAFARLVQQHFEPC